MTARRDAAVLQVVLAGEHAAVYGYGVAGARLSGRQRDRAVAAWTAHRLRRDELSALIRALGAQPVPAEATYALPHAVTTAADAVALATLLEERLAALYADAVAELDGRLRRLCVDGLRGCAVRAARWRRGSVAFPGLPERG